MIDTAIILAGGLGTRLRPLTNETPKPLLPLKGKPIVQHTIEQLKKFGVTNIILSTGYKADVVKEFFGDGSAIGVNIKYSIEDKPLGTGGAIKQAAQGLDKAFFLVWGDNLMDIDYHGLHKAYLRDAPQVTMVLTPRDDVENFGVAQLEGSRIVSFVEKPKREEAPSTLINAGAFIIDPQCLKMLPERVSSMERDCFEKLAPLGEISAFTHDGQWFPTDTLQKYGLACVDFVPNIDLTKKKVIIADVDETICESCSEISSQMAEQINLMVKKGYTFAFISGTHASELKRMISSKVNEEHHLLANTGSVYEVIKNGDNKDIYNHSFNEQEKKEVMVAFEKLIIEFGIKSMTTKEDQLQDRDSQITLSAIGRGAPKELKTSFDPDGLTRKKWVEFIRPLLPEEYDIRIGGTTSLDVTKKGLDKEWGIRTFSGYHGIDLSSVIFLGDKLYPHGNDYPATRIVDCVAVRNPKDTLRELRKFP